MIIVGSILRLLQRIQRLVDDDFGGYGWDRTTDLTIMSRALSPAELRSPKGRAPYRNVRRETQQTDSTRSAFALVPRPTSGADG